MIQHRRRADSHALYSSVIEHGSAANTISEMIISSIWSALPRSHPLRYYWTAHLTNTTHRRYGYLYLVNENRQREREDKKHLNFHFLLFCLPSADKQRQPQNSISSKPRETQRQKISDFNEVIHSFTFYLILSQMSTHTHTWERLAETHSRHVDPRISASLCRGINAMINHYSLPLRDRAD